MAPPKAMLDALPTPIQNLMVYKQMEGTFVRVGETRKLRAFYAINATEPF